MIRCWLVFALVFAVWLSVDLGTAQAADPAINTWKWDQVNDRVVHDVATVGSSCRVWVEKYGTNQYRSWKRCGVNGTSSGITIISNTFGVTDSQTFLSLANPVPWLSIAKDGTGAITSAATGPSSGGTHYYSNSVVITPAGAMSLNMPNQRLLSSNYTTSCVGSVLTGFVDTPGGINQQDFTTLGSYVRDSTTAHNTLSGACTAADTLLVDFGTVTPSCQADFNYSMVFRGREVMSGPCSCLPLGYGIEDFLQPNQCSLINIVGDPARPNDALPGVGGSVRLAGNTFTNLDLPNETYYPGVIPVVGSDPNGGLAPGSGGAIGPGGTMGTGANGVGQSGGVSGVAGGGGGSAPGTGSGNCVAGAVNCNGDGSEDSGSVPSGSSFDDTITSPELGDWQSSITTFISGSPLVGALSGSHVDATSGSCSTSFSFHGHSATIDFCARAAWFELAGTFLLVAANLGAFYIVWRN